MLINIEKSLAGGQVLLKDALYNMLVFQTRLSQLAHNVITTLYFGRILVRSDQT